MLRAWRQKHRKTQAETAQLLGVHQTTIGEWESGQTMSVPTAVAIRKLTKIPIDAWAPEESSTDVHATTAKAS